MNKINSETRQKLLIWLIGTGYVLWDLWALLPIAQQKLSPDEAAISQIVNDPHAVAFRVVIAAALTLILDFTLDVRRNQRPSPRRIYDEYIKNHRGSLGGALATRLREDARNYLKIGKKRNQFVATGYYAFLSYELFWEELLTLNSQSEKKLNVYAVHCLGFEGMQESNPQAARWLETQQRLISQRGKIYRVLCGLGERPDGPIRQTAASMHSKKIDVYYYDKQARPYDMKTATELPKYNFRWDFAYVKETGDAVVWRIGPGSDAIDEALFFKGNIYDGRPLMKLWTEIKESASVFPFENDG